MHIPKMRRKMFLYLALFAAIILVVIWFLQIVMLDDIYGFVKRAQIQSAAHKITLVLEGDDVETEVYRIAEAENACVSVYKISNQFAREVVSAHLHGVCAIHNDESDALLAKIYQKASDGTRYYEVIESGDARRPDSIICAETLMGEGGEYLAVINSETEPIEATVSTLRYIIVLITAVLIAVSVVMSYFIAKKFTGPVAEMNAEAKKLALGDYSVNFQGGEFLETAELAGTLNYAAGELSKLDAMQKELIANISHDLRTPLTTILGFGEVMRDIPGENTPENMQVIIDETKRLSELVSDMLDLSRIVGGSRTLERCEFSLADAVRDTLERYNTLKERDGYTFLFEAPRDAVVYADKTLILQVVYNLVNNAVSYSGEDKTVRVSLTVKDSIARVSVTDTGDGIEADKLPFIWDRYYKGADYHKRGVRGTGLGLSIVKNALILHGADFGVSSTVGVGSTFWFEVPIIED